MWFEDARVGRRFETAARTITEADLVNFSGLSGDFNELHTNAEVMRGSEFGERIAHGALVLSIVTGLRSQTRLFEDTIIAFAEIRSWRFRAPVLINDTVRAVNEITEMRESAKPDRGVVVQHVTVLNQRDETVQEGDMVTILRRRGDGICG